MSLYAIVRVHEILKFFMRFVYFFSSKWTDFVSGLRLKSPMRIVFFSFHRVNFLIIFDWISRSGVSCFFDFGCHAPCRFTMRTHSTFIARSFVELFHRPLSRNGKLFSQKIYFSPIYFCFSEFLTKVTIPKLSLTYSE